MDIPFIDWGLFNQYVYGTRKSDFIIPKRAPGETIKLIEKLIRMVEKPVVSVLRITNVSEPTITIYHAPDEVASRCRYDCLSRWWLQYFSL